MDLQAVMNKELDPTVDEIPDPVEEGIFNTAFDMDTTAETDDEDADDSPLFEGEEAERYGSGRANPMPSIFTRRRKLGGMDLVPFGTPPDQRTVPNQDAAPRRGVFVREAVFDDVVREVLDGMEAYTEADREALRQSFRRVARALDREGRFEMKFGKNKENYESNLKKVLENVDLVALGRKAVKGAAMDKVLRKTLNMV